MNKEEYVSVRLVEGEETQVEDTADGLVSIMFEEGSAKMLVSGRVSTADLIIAKVMVEKGIDRLIANKTDMTKEQRMSMEEEVSKSMEEQESKSVNGDDN